jgi:hypothetical protein
MRAPASVDLIAMRKGSAWLKTTMVQCAWAGVRKTNGGSENLIENNIFWYGNKVDTMHASGGGNVFAYNYTDDAFGSSYPESPEAGINAGHYTTPHLELLEGNYSHNYKGDSYWG